MEALLALIIIAAVIFLFVKAVISAPLLVIAIVVAYFVFRKRNRRNL